MPELGAVKRDPESGYLAHYVGLDEERAWEVLRPGGTPHFVAHKDIEHWDDMEKRA